MCFFRYNFGDSTAGLNASRENSAAGYFMGYGQVPETDADTQALFAYEGRRLAKLIGVSDGLVDASRVLLEYSPAGSYANVAAQPTAKVFRLSAFDWGNRRAVGFFRSAWSVESEGTSGKHSYLAFKA